MITEERVAVERKRFLKGYESRMNAPIHSLYPKADQWTGKVISAAIEVHREKGPGLIKSIYEQCMMRELQLRHVPVENQIRVPIEYKGLEFEESLEVDIYVDNCLVIEIKAVQEVLPIHKAQLVSYMKLLNAPLGLLINFNETSLTKGISRMALPRTGYHGVHGDCNT